MALSRKSRWIVGALIVVAVLAVAIPFLVIHLILGKAPAKLTLPGATGSGTAGADSALSSSVSGTWKVGSGSTVGYRVEETLVGQHTTAVGRTSEVWGSLVMSDTAVIRGSFTADMASVKSDQSGRNSQFDGRIMDVSSYPTATFTLTSPIELGSLPANGASRQYAARGTLAMHGVNQTITISLSAERAGGSIYVLSDIPILFSRWNIANPSQAGLVTTADHGTLEVLLRLTRGTGNAASTSSGANSGGAQGGFGGSGGPPGGFSGGPGGPGGPGGGITVPSTTTPELTVPKS